MLKIDARIPVRFGAPRPGDALLVEEGEAVPSGYAAETFAGTAHAVGCACCGARSPASVALDRLFQRRARGEVGFFAGVTALVTSEAAELEVWAALRNDPVVSARFRLA